MRIGIDARFWGTFTGIGRYVEELTLAMIKEDKEANFVLFLRKENWNQVPDLPGISKVLADERWYTLREQIFLPKVFNGAGCDLLHFPHWNIPAGVKVPYVATIHDLLLLDYPSRRASLLGPVSYAIKKIGFNFVLRRAISRARVLIAPSHFTAGRLREHFPDSSSKINVIYEGVKELGVPADFQEIARKEVKQPYLLYVGNAYPHKNLETLIGASLKLKEMGERANLVLAGKSDDFYKRLKKRFADKGQIIFFGTAADKELEALYRNAEMYIFPSFQEGFGLPGLEAMARGVPVVASSAGALKEIYGNAALYFDPASADDLVRAVMRFRRDSGFRESLVAEGRAQSAKYSWKEAALKTLSIYKKAIINL